MSTPMYAASFVWPAVSNAVKKYAPKGREGSQRIDDGLVLYIRPAVGHDGYADGICEALHLGDNFS
eukprot:scaffold234453_cov14-Tisochrysis_lutea.AAC.1